MTWLSAPIRSVAQVVTGNTPPKSDEANYGSDVPWVKPPELGSTEPIVATSEMLSLQGAERARVLPKDAVLVSCIGSIGRVGIAGIPLATNQQINSVVCGPTLLPRFAMYWFMHSAEALAAAANNAVVPILNKGNFEKMPIPVWPLREQSRIVELLDEADRLRRLRREADVKAARILPVLFLKMFGDPATNPMGWPVEPLTKICNPKQWPTISAKELTESGYTVYGANGKIGFYSTYNHEFPTVLITCRGATCGTINVCEPKSYVTGNAMALDDPDTKKTSIEFLETYLNVRGLADTITGAAQPQITRQNLQPVTVFVPHPSIVEQFSRQARVIKKLLGDAEVGSRRLGGLFELLLQRAFSGQLTAKWREAHMKELLVEMEQQARLLNLPMPIEQEALV
jgi:type I restriction enzyme S subunit